jgi:adenylosuccinate synthase
MKKHLLVLGAQWGDEGKGKITDYLMKDYDICVRFNGGNNAGHTIYRDGKKIVLHTLPTGILTEGKVAVIGHGVLVNPIELVQEIKQLQELGYSITSKNLKISDKCFTILENHIQTDKDREKSFTIGTTLKGIGPAMEDKVKRSAGRLHGHINWMDADFTKYGEAYRFLNQFVTNTMDYILTAEFDGKRLLFESAQGIMLDIDYGPNYPFVTSTNCGLGGVFNGAAPIREDIEVMAVLKPYITYVGNGPLKHEIEPEIASKLQAEGKEYGSTTGRLRRVGWLDFEDLQYAIKAARIDSFALTKVDVFDKLDVHKFYFDDSTFKHEKKLSSDEIKEMIEDETDIMVKIVSFGPNMEDIEEWSDE